MTNDERAQIRAEGSGRSLSTKLPPFRSVMPKLEAADHRPAADRVSIGAGIVGAVTPLAQLDMALPVGARSPPMPRGLMADRRTVHSRPRWPMVGPSRRLAGSLGGPVPLLGARPRLIGPLRLLLGSPLIWRSVLGVCRAADCHGKRHGRDEDPHKVSPELLGALGRDRLSQGNNSTAVRKLREVLSQRSF